MFMLYDDARQGYEQYLVVYSEKGRADKGKHCKILYKIKFCGDL